MLIWLDLQLDRPDVTDWINDRGIPLTAPDARSATGGSTPASGALGIYQAILRRHPGWDIATLRGRRASGRRSPAGSVSVPRRRPRCPGHDLDSAAARAALDTAWGHNVPAECMTGGMPEPIELFYWPTPNGRKISIALHEMELPYNLNLVNIGRATSSSPTSSGSRPTTECRPSSIPTGRTAPISIFESGAILQYLGRKTGSSTARSDRQRIEIDQWLFWQVAGVGPMAGQANHFLKYAPSMDPPKELPYAQDRYRSEVFRLYGVLNRRLADREYVAGDYSIADMAIWPWARGWEGQQQDIGAPPTWRRGSTGWRRVPPSRKAPRSARTQRATSRPTARPSGSCSSRPGRRWGGDEVRAGLSISREGRGSGMKKLRRGGGWAVRLVGDDDREA